MRFVLTLLTPILLAFYVSYRAGEHWVEELIPVFPTVLVAVLGVIIIIPESFAGERERHTLETLLSTRLGDGSILFGKLGVALVLAMALAFVVLGLGLVTANAFHYRGEFLMYTSQNLILSLGLSFLFSFLVGCMGIIVSLRSETVQEATQTLAGITLVPPILLGVVTLVFSQPLVELVQLLGRPSVGIGVMAAFGFLIAGLLFEVRRRFDRSRLLERR
jgi:ABC-2 type transport system permease protein